MTIARRARFHLTRCLRTLCARLPPLVAASGAREGLWLEQRALAYLPNVVRPCCREAAALRGALHAKRGGAAAQPRFAGLPDVRRSRCQVLGPNNVRQYRLEN